MRNMPVVIASCIVGLFSVSAACAQEHCKVNEDVSAKNSTYTEQHVMKLDDFPGHIIRIAEVKRTYPDDKPNCEGLKRKESVDRFYTDYKSGSGTIHGYSTITFDNGDKLFTELVSLSQGQINQDGSVTGVSYGVRTYTGGTGKYAGVHGFIKQTTKFDTGKKTNEIHWEGEYWISK